MSDERRLPLEAPQQALGNGFFSGSAEGLREHLQLRLEERAARDRIAEATGITDTKVLAELAGLGIRVDTLSALTLIPLIDVAWVDGDMDERERQAVLDGAVGTGIERGSTSYRLLEIWIEEAPPPDLALLWRDFTRALCAQLSAGQVERLRGNILGRARDVAAAAGDTQERSPHVSDQEEQRLTELSEAFAAA